MKYVIVFCFYWLQLNVSFAQENQATTNEIAVKPSFKGGREAMRQFVSQHLVYPKQDLKNGVSARIMVKFRLKADGSIDKESVSVVKNPFTSLSLEAERIVKLMPDWNSGKLSDGTPVSANTVVPIFFNANNYWAKPKKKKKRRRN